MTTINNDQSLIEKVGGIDRAIALEAMLQKHAVPESWRISIINGMWHRSSVGFTHNDLRTAIAKHDSRAFKIGDDIRYMGIDRKTPHPEIFKVVGFDSMPGGGDGYKIKNCLGQIDFCYGDNYVLVDCDAIKLCIGCGSPDLHKGGEIKEPKMCFDCFAEMVGFTRTSNGFVESDEVIDIRNHVSPSTRVVDL